MVDIPGGLYTTFCERSCPLTLILHLAVLGVTAHLQLQSQEITLLLRVSVRALVVSRVMPC